MSEFRKYDLGKSLFAIIIMTTIWMMLTPDLERVSDRALVIYIFMIFAQVCIGFVVQMFIFKACRKNENERA